MSNELAQKSCGDYCQASSALMPEEQAKLGSALPDWEIVDAKHLERSYTFKNFKEALAFVNQISEIAEAEKHHPDIYFTWGKATIKIMTHSVDGLTEADFILAAKISEV